MDKLGQDIEQPVTGGCIGRPFDSEAQHQADQQEGQNRNPNYDMNRFKRQSISKPSTAATAL
jgi:hypothetical protein